MGREETSFPHAFFAQCICVWSILFGSVVSDVPLGSRLSIAENNSWVSSQGDFALGFHSHPEMPNRYCLGIRFNSHSIPSDKQVVAWVAGAEVTVSNNSYFELNQDGELVLSDSTLGTVWSSKSSKMSVDSAHLGDDGNLVLLNPDKQIVWQSFDNPSDTLLPGQKLPAFHMLRAASKNSVSSYYSLQMASEGRLELTWESNISVWSSGNPPGENLSAVLTSEGGLFVVGETKEHVWSAYGEDHNDTAVKYRFVRLDVDGNLRMYSWIQAAESWKPVWQAVENQCKVFATCGSRLCEFNSSGFAECKCPFEGLPGSGSKCLAPYQRGCKSGLAILEHKHTSMYGIYPANDSVFITNLENCKSSCLEDPACTAVTYMNDGTAECRMKLTRYISGYSDPSLSSISLVKKCLDPVAVDPGPPRASAPGSLRAHSHHKLCLRCLLAAASAIFVLFIGFQIGIGLFICRRRRWVRRKDTPFSMGTNPNGLTVLTFNEIKDITENFKHCISPTIFGGVLLGNIPVAIKEVEAATEERKFRSAAFKIGSIHHKNVGKLEAYCCEFNRRYLVYEYGRKGSLKKYMDDVSRSKRLTWRKRASISLSVAKALCYLHTECREFVSHGNLRLENVVLDENLEAKLTEYGLGLINEDSSSSSAQKDVEDFGKLVLAMVTGFQESEELYQWAYREWFEGRVENIVDRRLEGGFKLEELERAVRIAFWCVQGDERLRPSMGEVVKVLEGTLSVDPPPPPFDHRRSPSESPESPSGSKS